jgi:hypothetical protein
VWWSATKTKKQTILKLVNYNGKTGQDGAVQIQIQGSKARKAELTVFTAASDKSTNKIPSQGGNEHSITTQTIKGINGLFEVTFTKPFEIVILTV